MKSLPEKFIKLIFSIVYFFNKLDDRFFKKMVDLLLINSIVNSHIADFYSVTVRPKKTPSLNINNFDHSDFTILLQGQIIHENNFTLETVKTYRNFFPKSKIILSTWVGISESLLNEFAALDCICILSQLPENAGYTNFNLQLTTVKAGLEKAAAFNTKFLIKTRTDQRIYEPNALIFLGELWTIFKVKSNLGLTGRIFILGSSTYKNIPFHIGDMMQFGAHDDLRLFWDVPFQNFTLTRGNHLDMFSGKLTLGEFINLETSTPEIYLGKNLWRNLYKSNPLDGDIERNYNQLLSDVIGFFDASQVQLYWPKYSSIENLYIEGRDLLKETVTFSDWFLFSNKKIDRICLFNPKILVN